jgi:TolA-binding protein
MKTTCLAALITVCLTLFGCSGDNAQSLFETAQLEELQHNTEHAEKLYREIIDKYPQSPYAEQAKDRLSAMQ